MASPATGMLDGLRVLDLASGSYGQAGKLFASMGADVIKVEPPEGDPVRLHPPFKDDIPDRETSARHLHFNTGKRSITLDLDHPEGQALLRRLVARADILVESYDPGYLAARGLGYDDLARERPDLIMASLTYFGQDGPYAEYEGAEIVAGALGGYLKLTGDPDREPVKPYDDLVTQHAAMHAATAVLTGVFQRDLTGEGDCFDVAAVDAALFLQGGTSQFYFANRQLPVRNGTRLIERQPNLNYPSTLRPCRDGWVHAHANAHHLDLLAVLMEDPRIDELMVLPRGNADEIDARMDAWLADYDRADAVQRAQELRLPFTEVFLPDEILDDRHLNERGYFVDVEHPVAGTVKQPGAPLRASAAPLRITRAPLLGEHTEQVLGELLGLDGADVARLREAGVL